MSEDQATNTDVIVYVRLLDESVDVWRPVPATAASDGTFLLAEPRDYDPESEIWEFAPHTRVECRTKKFAGGQDGLVAVRAVG